MSNQPFPLADDYSPPEHEAFELRETTPPPVSGESPLTMPQRMYALEKRQLEQSRDLKAVNVKVDKILTILSWKNTAKTTLKAIAPVLLTGAAAQFPQAKHFLQALLDSIQVFQ